MRHARAEGREAESEGQDQQQPDDDAVPARWSTATRWSLQGPGLARPSTVPAGTVYRVRHSTSQGDD
ncbi:MAG: hypothetical protein AVDCRST_MAG52-1259 [uncultured Blastococcus sp.]|uniref:Uncharacterized protein n=1 Tax=uncultured Blastococcus sp. TaxID=217144 RepID=A0A6J4HVW3_9ACTN|nr:MAG: hypothetical protein AVDCRST_MAG52-1259 [uncultured Blastococcus sp.]